MNHMPPPLPSTERAIIVRERLRILAWGYYLSAGFGALFACFVLIQALMFGAISFVPESEWGTSPNEQREDPHGSENEADQTSEKPSAAPPALVFRIVAGVMIAVTVGGWILSGLTGYAAYCIQQRTRQTFIQVMAGYNLLWMPYGTALGVFTFITLNSPEARWEFERAKR